MKYRVTRGGNTVTKALSLERATMRAQQFAAKSPHLTFSVVSSSGQIVATY